jgi:hypothetical protein
MKDVCAFQVTIYAACTFLLTDLEIRATYVSTMVKGVASGVASGGSIAGGMTGATLSSKLFDMKQLMMELLPTPRSPSTTILTVIFQSLSYTADGIYSPSKLQSLWQPGSEVWQLQVVEQDWFFRFREFLGDIDHKAQRFAFTFCVGIVRQSKTF